MEGREVLARPRQPRPPPRRAAAGRIAVDGNAPLGLEQRAAPRRGPPRGSRAGSGDAGCSIAYPGVWLREDVYATHGHYMDCHMTPARARVPGRGGRDAGLRPLPDPAAPGRLRADAAARLRASPTGSRRCGSRAERPDPSLRARVALDLAGAIASTAALAALPCGLPSAPASRRPSGPSTGCCAPISTPISRRRRSPAAASRRPPSWPAASGSRRPRDHGPHAPRRARREDEDEWELPGGGSLHNTGSWVFASAFHHPGDAAGPLLARDGHMARGRRAAAPRSGCSHEHPREELKATVRRARGRAAANRRATRR